MNLTETDTREIRQRIAAYLKEVGKTIPAGYAISVTLVPQPQVNINLEVKADPMAEYGQKPIAFLNLDVRTQNAFDNQERFERIQDLLAINRWNELVTIRGFGHKCFREVREKLQNLGFKLGHNWKLPGGANRGWQPDPNT